KVGKAEGQGQVSQVSVTLDEVPPGFDMRYARLAKSVVEYNPDEKKLTAKAPLDRKEEQALLVAGGAPEFRDAVNALYQQSSKFTVSSGWLFWSFILATLGELCLSPVGLSMVSKLAPARFATMLMGVWLMTSSFGNYLAGALGESY